MTRRHPDPEDHGGHDEFDRDYTEFGYRELGRADALDRYLDGELERNSAAFRSEFVKGEFRGRLAETEKILADLARPMRSPDLTDSILDQVDARKPFVAKRTRRFVTVGRLAAAAAVLLITGVGVLVEHARPGSLRFSHEPTPITSMVHASAWRGNDMMAAMPASAPASGPVAPASGSAANRERSILGWGIAKLGTVQTFEVRGASMSWTSERGIATGNRGPWRLQDRTSEPSAGFATFPVPDGAEQVWYAAGR